MNSKLTIGAFYLTLLSAIALMIIGIFYPPQGVIDKTVIESCAILLFFGTVAQVPEFIKAGHQIKLDKGDFHIEVKKKEGNE